MKRPQGRTITLDEWLAEEKLRLKHFEDFYRKGNGHDPTCFPGVMDLGDWDEQYQMFIDDKNAAEKGK